MKTILAIALSLACVSAAMAQNQASTTPAQSCTTVHKTAAAYCDSDKMNVGSRDHCHMHVDQELGFCKSSGKWNLANRWGGSGQVSGLTRQ